MSRDLGSFPFGTFPPILVELARPPHNLSFCLGSSDMCVLREVSSMVLMTIRFLIAFFPYPLRGPEACSAILVNKHNVLLCVRVVFSRHGTTTQIRRIARILQE